MAYTSLQHKIVKPQKDRQCIMCFRVTKKGQPMYYSAGVFDGEFQSHYCCLTCDAIFEIYSRRYREYEFDAGWVADGLNKGETPEDYLKKLKSEKLVD